MNFIKMKKGIMRTRIHKLIFQKIKQKNDEKLKKNYPERNLMDVS